MSKIEVAAYYFPQFHPDPKNDLMHGKGWTEWEVLKVAHPRFEGHRQPIVPAWGYFDESDPAWAAREIDLAADHGLTCFLYDWYWYEGQPFLEGGLEHGFLKAPNTNRMKFALMWANHHWMDLFPANYRNHPEVFWSGHVKPDMFAKLADYVIEHYFSQPNYLQIEGEPWFTIYEIGSFIEGAGGLEAATQAVEDFRKRAQMAGHRGVHINTIHWDSQAVSTQFKLKDPMEIVKALGISSVGSYTWGPYADENDPFPHASYAKAVVANKAWWPEALKQFPVPFHPHVTMGWDSSPRTLQSDIFENRGYPWTHILEGNTPALFREGLRNAREFVERPDVPQKVVTINAWNEWTEGSYLLPDTVTGNAFVEAIREVFPPEV
jgi:hypothetical protein